MMGVSREKLRAYSDLLLKWNNSINLISSSTIHEVLERHINDSLQLLSFIQKDISIIDLGSGGGVPGVILSLAGVKKITLIESDSRKAAFLLQAAKLSDETIIVVNDRLENLVGLECDIVTSRAFADLNKIFDLSQNIKIKDKYLLHKGKKYQEEIFEAKKHWLFDSKVHDSITSESGKILEITNVTHIS